MHIPDGIIPVQVCIAGYAATAGLTGYALRRIERRGDPRRQIPQAALLSAAFFVASWIHIPVPPASVHLVLNGLLGAILGWAAVPAIVIGLFFQAVLFQHGGLTTLGINATIMAVPALIAAALFSVRHLFGPANRLGTGLFAFLAGGSGVGLAVLLFYGLLVLSLPVTIDRAAEQAAIGALALAHLPLVVLEGTFTMLVALFLLQVRPDLLDIRPEAAVVAAPAGDQA